MSSEAASGPEVTRREPGQWEGRERELVRRLRDLQRRNAALAVTLDASEERITGLEKELRARAERLDRVEFLFREIDHRVKNTLAGIQEIVERSARTAPSTAAFLEAFRPRLTALARTYEILAAERWAGAKLSLLVRTSVEPYLTEFDQLVRQDDDVLLPGRMATPLVMALHELAANAAKHGALSVPTGKVHVDATMDHSRGEMQITWQESGGPEVPPAAYEGFGMTVIRRGVTYELGGRTDVHFEPAGVRARLTFPLPPDDASGSSADATDEL